MAWSKLLFQLRDALATLIPFRNDVIPYLQEAGIQWQIIQFSDSPYTLWYNILNYTDLNNLTENLVSVLQARFPTNPHLLAYSEKIKYSLGPSMENVEWKGKVDPGTLEKITGAHTTLLPISFLEAGLKKSRAVVRIQIKRAGSIEAGTGFLLKNNLILTNNHVIPDESTADIALIQFDYEESLAGLAKQPTEFQLGKENGFATSVEDDWTAVRLKGDANTAFGAIELKPASIRKDDFVNIIQHPGGRFKQIGMYHNMVTFSNDKVIQYLTDTEPGSSGAPVFNSNWEVVALHHSGGMLREPGTEQTLLRNEGININKVIEGLKAANL